MDEKSSIRSIDKITVFAKAHPKVTKVAGGFTFEFSDVLSVARQQEVKATNASTEDINKVIGKDRMKLSKGGGENQLEFPWFGDK